MGSNIIPTGKPYPVYDWKPYSKTDNVPLPVCTIVRLGLAVVTILVPYHTLSINEFNIATKLVSQLSWHTWL